MYPAPSFDDMRRTLEKHRTEVIGVLFAPPYTKVGRENIAPRLGYLDGRTGQHIHFFCAGYGGYQFADDLVPVGNMQYDNGVVIPRMAPSIIRPAFSKRSSSTSETGSTLLQLAGSATPRVSAC